MKAFMVALLLLLGAPAMAQAETWILWTKEAYDTRRRPEPKWKAGVDFETKAACLRLLRKEIAREAMVVHKAGARIIDFSKPQPEPAADGRPRYTYMTPPLPPTLTEFLYEMPSGVLGEFSYRCWPVGVNPQ